MGNGSTLNRATDHQYVKDGLVMKRNENATNQ
jgi:hypothetical protein